MPLLARKIARQKWDGPEWDPGAIAADTLVDLKSTNNTLSFWTCDEGNVADAVLALAAACERIDRLDIVVLERSDLERCGVAFASTPGATPVADLVDRHLDAVRLDATRVVAVARVIANRVRPERTACRRFAKQEVRAVLERAVADRRVVLADLQEKVRAELGKARPKR